MASPLSEITVHPHSGGRVRVGVWLVHLALPLLALWLLIAQPGLDVRWEHQPSHFWLVMAVAGVNVALAYQIMRSARIRSDARLILVSHAFLLAAGFLLLHALATPGVIVPGSNGGFEIATPVGLSLAALFFAASSLELGPETSQRVVEREPATRWALIGIMTAWAVVSLAGLPPLADPLAERAEGPLRWAAIAAIGLYTMTAVRYFQHHRRKPSVMLVALITASALLAESMATIVWARPWQLSWWLWHLLMAAAFGFVAYSAYVQYTREGDSAGIFDGIVTPETAEEIREEYGGALELLTSTLQRSAQAGVTEEELELIVTGLRSRFSLTEGQTEVLARAARSLATERDQARRLQALARIGTEALVERSEEDLLTLITSAVAEGFSPDVMRIGLPAGDGITYPDRLATAPWPAEADRHAAEVTVGDERVALMEFARPGGSFEARDTSIIDTLAAETGIAVANVRLYRQLETLFRSYLSPDVADSLRADPTQADLGGSLVELTALFADLRGFTTFTERTDPEDVMEMLNRYFGLAVPIIFGNGGTVVQFVGDALLAVFDAPRPRPDHAFRAARSALAIQEAVDAEARTGQGWPRFRIGINTGLALIGNVGSDQLRSFNVVGDAVNTAARLETSADPGTVLIGDPTYRQIADRVEVTTIGALELKGKEQQVIAHRLERVSDGPGSSSAG